MTGPGGPVDPDGPFGVLLAVQDLDTAIAQHEHRKSTLAERAELSALAGRTAGLRRSSAELAEQRNELATRLSQLEQQSAAARSRHELLEARLYGARGAAGRDLQAIEGEVDQLASRMDQLDEEELSLMEEQEPIDAELDRYRAELAELVRRSEELTARVAEIDTTVDVELAELTTRRRAEAARLPEALARRYEDLRRRLGGTGAARLVGDRCDGCHLTLPAMEVDRIRRLPPDTVVTCEQCGRILVRTSLVGGS